MGFFHSFVRSLIMHFSHHKPKCWPTCLFSLHVRLGTTLIRLVKRVMRDVMRVYLSLYVNEFSEIVLSREIVDNNVIALE